MQQARSKVVSIRRLSPTAQRLQRRAAQIRKHQESLKGRQKSVRVHAVRMPAADKARIDAAAEVADVTLADFTNAALLDAANAVLRGRGRVAAA